MNNKFFLTFLFGMKMKNISFHYVLISFFLSFIFYSTGCTKLVEVDPPANNITGTAVYSNDASAAAVMAGLYTQMIGQNSMSGSGSISALAGISADELKNYNISDQRLSLMYTNSMSSTDVPFWNELYKYIYHANAVIAGLSANPTIKDAVKKQLIGEAKFVRAFCYFYLVNLFGDIPLVLTTDYMVNNLLPRTPKRQVYEQIITDLKEARQLLSENYVGADAITVTSERTRPNKWVAMALLARVYLYSGTWRDAEATATEIIENTSTFQLLPDLNSVFLKNSQESIWQFQPVIPGFNTLDAYYFILRGKPGMFLPFAISDFLLNAIEPGDKRKLNWIKDTTIENYTYYYPYKYKVKGGNLSLPVTEYLMVFRLAEQILIRAEARANQGDIIGSAADLNLIRLRAGLQPTVANNKLTLLTAILHERQVEFFTEWGHRWLDLKRNNKIDNIMNIVCPNKGGSWNSDHQLFPIPLLDIQANPGLRQNPGYN